MEYTKSKLIVILDSESRKALAMTRAFGKLGHVVINVSKLKKPLAGSSKYSKSVIKISEYTEDVLLDLITMCNCDILLPCEEKTLEIILKSKLIKDRVECYAPSLENFNIANDKLLTMKHASGLGINIPKTILIDDYNDLTREIASNSNLEYPLIIKPRKSSGSRGIVKVNNKVELLNHIKVVYMEYGPLIVQEFIPHGGDAIGVSFFIIDGEEVLYFMHKRIREFPVNGGPSTFCVSIFDESILEISRKLVKSLSWNGLVMVEFKIDPRTNQPVLMEINPRIWGSVQLAISSNANFARAMIEGKKYTQQTYKIGHYLRWYFPADILSIIKSKKGIIYKITNLINIKFKNTSYMVFDRMDIKPSFSYFFSTLSQFLSPSKIKKNINRGV